MFKPQLISKCTLQLQRCLSVSVCKMKINVLKSVFLSLVHPPEILTLPVSPSDFTWAAGDGDSPDVQPARGAGHQGLITSHSTLKKKKTYFSWYICTKPALIPMELVALHIWELIQGLCTTAPIGEEVKNWAAQLAWPGEGPKAKTAASQAVEQPDLLSLSVLSQLSHFLCCSLWHLLVFSPLRFLFPN